MPPIFDGTGGGICYTVLADFPMSLVKANGQTMTDMIEHAKQLRVSSGLRGSYGHEHGQDG